MKKTSFICLIFLSQLLFSQVGIGTTNPHESSIFELKSTTKGFLPPRMTNLQRNNIVNPDEGLMIFNIDRGSLQFYRKDVGQSNSLNGWYDLNCVNDISNALSVLGNGIVLDFTNQEEYGKFYPQINGGGTAFTSSTADGTNYKSIGPIPSDITDLNSSSTYINWVNGITETSNPFVFNNSDTPNKYNAATFLSRNLAINSSYNSGGKTADKMKSTLSPYYGDIDIVLVAKSTGLAPNRTAFFSTGPNNVGIQIGVGDNNYSNGCLRNYYNIMIAERNVLCGGTANRVKRDNDFHRFRVQYTASTRNVKFYIDGILILSTNLTVAQIQNNGGNFHNIIQNLKLFAMADDSDKRQLRGSIAFLGIYTTHLTSTDFSSLDNYLACKFEVQP